MNEDPQKKKTPPDARSGKTAAPGEDSQPDARKSDIPLTPEEQMALYEKDLKENDWGHQPC